MKRDLRAYWPRFVGFIGLSVVLWLCMDMVDPRTQEIETRSCEKLVKEVFDKILVQKYGADGKLVVRDAQTAGQVPGCQQAIAAKVHAPLDQLLAQGRGKPSHGVLIDPAASKLELKVTSDRRGTDIVLNVELILKVPGKSTEVVANITRDIAVPDAMSLLPPLLAVILARCCAWMDSQTMQGRLENMKSKAKETIGDLSPPWRKVTREQSSSATRWS